MDVVTTSLEALIQRVTNPQNQKPDIAAIEAFCVMLAKEPDGIQIGTKLLALHIQSSTEPEALQALVLLDTCMRRCGPSFHAEIGKFRFLNEMIRLVSPKYLGGRTPLPVQQKVLQLLRAWTKEYPKESKIKEAYEMLKNQGVVEENTSPIMDSTDSGGKSSKAKATIFVAEEKSKLLQSLLQSKDPCDLQTANRLIKAMVREDERRVQLNSRRVMELESVRGNVKLLSEMLDSYDRNESTTEDLELMKELHQACERFTPILLRLANETQHNEEMLGNVLAASDELGLVLEKYTAVIVRGETVKTTRTGASASSPSLLDLSSPTESIPYDVDKSTTYGTTSTDVRSDMEVLGDIFNSLEKSAETTSSSSVISNSGILTPHSTIMQPISILPTTKKGEGVDTPEKRLDGKARALEELNELGETLLKQSLSCTTILNVRSNTGSKQTTKHTGKDGPLLEQLGSMTFHDSSRSDALLDSTDTGSSGVGETRENHFDLLSDRDSPSDVAMLSCKTTGYGSIADARLSSALQNDDISILCSVPSTPQTPSTPLDAEPKVKPLTDINVSLQDIKPGNAPPVTVIDEKNGISVVLHFARDNPRPDVTVVVITTMSKNAKPLSNYLFQAVVPKSCKCRLQAPSGTELPARNPFLPPSAITQVMLIANPHKERVPLKFMLSYTMDDETFTEMGEVEELPPS